MQNASRKMAKLGKSMQKVGKKLSRNLTLPIVALGVASVLTFANFEQGMAKVKAVSGATELQFKALTESAKELGASTRFTAVQVSELQLAYSKLGFNPGEINKVTAATLDLALATGEDLASSATVAASTLRGFELAAGEMGRVVDVMALSFGSSALDLEKFKVAMSTLAPVAKNAGVGLEEATSFLSILVDRGVDASTAGTGLRNMFLNLARSGKTLSGSLGEINNSTNKNATALKLFGKRGATVATIMANNIKAAKGLASSYDNAGGSAKKMAAIMDDTLKGGLLRLKSAFEGLQISIGEQLKDSVSSLASTFSGLLSKFDKLSDSSKKTIIVIAAFAAALGPVIVITGTLIRNLAAIIPLVKGLTLAIAANPIGAFAVAITALAGGLLLANSRFSSLTSATKEFNDLTVDATSNIAKEKAELERYLSVAKNDKTSKEDRQRAIKKLNKLSPKYLGDLSLETINTDAATVATDKYVASLLKKAKVIAAEEKLVEVQKRLLNLQLGVNDAIDLSFWQNFGNLLKSGAGGGMAFASKKAQTLTENLKLEKIELGKLEAALLSFINTNDGLASVTKKKIIITPTLSVSGGDDLDSLDLENSMFDLDGLDQMIEAANIGGRIQESIDSTSFESMFDKLTDGFESFTEEKLPELLDKLEIKMQRIVETGVAVGRAVGDAFSNLATNMVESMGIASSGMAGFVKNILKLSIELISILIKNAIKNIAVRQAESMANAISGATSSGAATGPAAIFTTPAFIATAIGGVLAAFAAIPKFETGGVIGGSSFYGDKLLVRANSNELILNHDQQKRLYELSAPGSSGGEIFIARNVISGEDIITVYERAERRKNRVG